MINIVVKQKGKPLTKPFYTLEMKYMIGDANGNTSNKMEIDVEHAPRIERFCRILDKLKTKKGTWGIILDDDYYPSMWSEKMVSRSEYLFFLWSLNDYNDIKQDESLELTEAELELIDTFEFKDEDDYFSFGEVISGVTEYSFLVYKGYKLTYTDEHGETFNTSFSDD